MPEKTLKDIVYELRSLLAAPRVSELPWKYGQCRIEPRISDIWTIDNKTLARAAVNALPRLLAAVEPLIAEEDRKLRQREDAIIAEAEAIKAIRARAVAQS